MRPSSRCLTIGDAVKVFVSANETGFFHKPLISLEVFDGASLLLCD